MTGGRVASNGHVNTSRAKRTAVPKGIDRDTRRTDQQARDITQRELEQAAASLVVIALAGSDSGMVLGMLGLRNVTEARTPQADPWLGHEYQGLNERGNP